MVLGSPWSKCCPEGFAREKALDQMCQWCVEIGDEAEKRGIIIALEPNNQQETNLLNTFADVVALAKSAGHPNIRCLQDYYHLKMERDTVDSLVRDGKEYLVHSHFARFDKRGFPKDWTEDAYYPVYFEALKKLHYDSGISMEGFPKSRESFAVEAAATCRFLKEAVGR